MWLHPMVPPFSYNSEAVVITNYMCIGEGWIDLCNMILLYYRDNMPIICFMATTHGIINKLSIMIVAINYEIYQHYLYSY